MPIKSIEQLSAFLKTRDWINTKVRNICNKYGYSSSISSWEVKGDLLVVHFVSGGQFHPATYFTREFPLTELFMEHYNDR